MLRLATACLLACSFATSAQAMDSLASRYGVDIGAEGEAGPGSGPTGTCGQYTGGDLETGCEYGPASFWDGSGESDYGPGDREGGMPDENPSDGSLCPDYEYYPDVYGCA